ncbi:MAG: AzlD domain-containing protein [Actinomycetota bacterium]
MSPVTTTILLLAAGTYLLKSAGPLLLGGDRVLPARLERLAVLLPAPLLAAMVAVGVLVSEQRWTIDAQAVGLVAAACALLARLPFVVVVLIAAAATAATRAVAG